MRARPKIRVYGENGAINWREKPEPELIEWEKEFANECDKLAELEAKNTGKRHWGRWYLTRTSLNTRMTRPRVEGGAASFRGGIYDIDLDRLDGHWIAHMGRKNWVGEKGIQDLARALDDLSKIKMG